jgi:hypothetical protein
MAPGRRSTEHLETELARLAPRLDELQVGEPPTALVERTLRAARLELARTPAAPVSQPLPAGFKRELVRVLSLTAAPGALAIVWNALVILVAPALLSQWLPEGIAGALVAAYAFAALGWLALVYGSLPFVAHRRALMRHQGAT